MTQLSPVDYLILVAYLVATVAIGLWIGRRLHSGRDYFLGGRSLPWWAIGMSLVATDIGGTDIIGVGGASYTYGLAVANFEWIGCVPAMIVGAFVFIPIFWRSGVYTIPEFMERRFNVGMRVSLATCWLVFMACNLGIMLLASANMLDALFGWDPVICIFVTAVLAGGYTLAGGLSAVVYTDMIQCAVMIGGCLLVLVLGLIEVGGVGGLRERVAEREREMRGEDVVAGAAIDAGAEGRPEHMKLVLPVDTATPFPWPGILFGLAMILSPAYWIGNQAIVQRSLGAKSEFQAKAAYVWGALLKNVIPIIIAIPGLIAFALYPELEDGDHAFPELVAKLLPSGLRAIFLAAFIAALMSSIDSYLNSASTIATHDFYVRFFRPRADDRDLLMVGRIVTFLLVLWAIGFALYLTSTSQQIYTVFQTLMAFFQGPAFAVILAGLLWRRATGRGALVGFLAGVFSAITLFALNQPVVYEALGWPSLFQIEEPFLYFSIWAFLITSVLVVGVSWLTPPESEEKLSLVVSWRGIVRRRRAATADSEGV